MNIGFGNKKVLNEKNKLVIRYFRSWEVKNGEYIRRKLVKRSDGVRELWVVGKLSKYEGSKLRELWKSGGYKLVM